MTEIKKGDRRRVEVEVQTCAPVEGLYGAQWELKVQYPFSKFPTTTWVERDDVPEPVEPGTYRCLIHRDGLKEGKDGSADFHYNWRILELGLTRPVENDTPKDKPAPKSDNKPRPALTTDERIQRQVAFKGAVEIAVALIAKTKLTDPDMSTAIVSDLTDAFDAILSGSDLPTQATEGAGEPISDSSGSRDPLGGDIGPPGEELELPW